MQTLINSFSHSDWLQLFSIIASLSISVVSIIIAIFTLRQNNKMIETSTRPYITIYGTHTIVNNFRYFFVLKNFGQTGATITSFKSDYDLINLISAKNPRTPFEHAVGTFLAPGQAIRYNVDNLKFRTNNISIIKFDIEYTTSNKKYSEHIELNTAYIFDILSPRASCDDKNLNVIAHILQDINEKQL